MVGQCYDRRGRTPSAAPKHPTIKWTYTVTDGEMGLDAVVDAKGRMLASSTSANGTGILVRFSAAGGTPETLFTYKSQGYHPLALGTDGTLYTSDGTDLIGLDVSGSAASLRWTIATPATGAFTSLVVSGKGEIHAVSGRGDFQNPFPAGYDLFVFGPDRSTLWDFPNLGHTRLETFADDTSLVYALGSGAGGSTFMALDRKKTAFTPPSGFLGWTVNTTGLVHGVVGSVVGAGNKTYAITAVDRRDGASPWQLPLATSNDGLGLGNESPWGMVLAKDGALGVITSSRLFASQGYRIAWQVKVSNLGSVAKGNLGTSLFVDRDGTFVVTDAATVAAYDKDGHSVFSVAKSGVIQVLPGSDGMVYGFTNGNTQQIVGIGD